MPWLITSSTLVLLLLSVLTCWRITSILHDEEIAAPIRKWVGGEFLFDEWVYPDTFVGHLFGCFWCLSMWVALPVALLFFGWLGFLLVPAVSAGAIFLYERVY